MGQRYHLEPAAMTAIGVPWHAPLRGFPRFGDTVDRGCGPVQTMDTRKATELLSRAGPTVGTEIVCQSEILSVRVLNVEAMSLNWNKVFVGADDLS
jgi:hypothetical protein